MANSINGGVKVERRKYIRIAQKDIVLCSKFSAKDFVNDKIEEKAKTVTKNYSAGGVLFESNVKFNVGTLIKLEIKVPGWERFKSEFYKNDDVARLNPVVILATVVRVEIVVPDSLYDIGVCFSAIDKGHKWALIKYINKVRKV